MFSINCFLHYGKGVMLSGASLMATAIAVAIVSSQAVAEPVCKFVTGHFHEHQVSTLSTPHCTTEVNGLCAAGPIKGSIHGTYNFALTGSQSANLLGDVTFPSSVIHFTGQNIIQTKQGDLFGVEAGALDTASPGNYSDLMIITGGTGAFVGASGQLYFFGNFDLATGSGYSHYEGTLCTY